MPTLLAGDLKTGLIRFRNLPASSGSASCTLNGAGAVSGALRLPLLDVETGVVADFIGTIAPGKSFLAYEVDGEIIQAGPIWADSWDNDTGTLTLTGAGLRSYWDHRYVLPALTGGDTPLDVTTELGPLSLRTIAKRLVSQAQAWTNGSVPVVLESDVAGSNTRTYLGADLHRVGEALSNLSGVIGGPDIAFRPRFNTARTHIEWVMLTGNPELTQGGPDHVWDTTVPVPAVKGVKVTRDARSLVTDSYQKGGGDGPALMGVSSDSTLTAAGFLRMEAAEDRSSVSTQSVLDDHAEGATRRGRFYTETWALEAHRFASPRLGTYWEGDYARAVFRGNPRIPDGSHRVRILSLATSLQDPFVKLALAPERTFS